MRRGLLLLVPLVAAAGLWVLVSSDGPAARGSGPARVLLGAQPRAEGALATPAPTPSRAAPTPAKPGPSPCQDPTPAAIDALERLLESDDRVGLRDYVVRERSWARLEALRQLLERGGRDELPGLLDLLRDGDPVLQELIGDACAAGGDASLAERLAVELGALTQPRARRLAAGAVLAIDADPARGRVSPVVQRVAVEALTALAQRDDLLEAEAACDALGGGSPAAVRATLGMLASDRGLDPDVRLAAIEALGSPEGLLLALGEDCPQHPAGRLARSMSSR